MTLTVNLPICFFKYRTIYFKEITSTYILLAYSLPVFRFRVVSVV